MQHIIDEERFIPTLTLSQKREKNGYYDNLKILALKRFPGTVAFFNESYGTEAVAYKVH